MPWGVSQAVHGGGLKYEPIWAKCWPGPTDEIKIPGIAENALLLCMRARLGTCGRWGALVWCWSMPLSRSPPLRPPLTPTHTHSPLPSPALPHSQPLPHARPHSPTLPHASPRSPTLIQHVLEGVWRCFIISRTSFSTGQHFAHMDSFFYPPP